MATSRKQGGRAKSKAAKPRSRPAAKASSRKPSATAKPKHPARPAHRPVAARPAAKVVKAAAKPAVKPPIKPAPPAKFGGKPLPAAPAKFGGKPLPAAPVLKKGAPAVVAKKGEAVKKAPAAKKAKRPAVPEVVRPLGVLPPESIARPRERPVVRATPPKPAPAAPARPRTPASGAQPLTEQDLKHFEQRLLAERAKLMREMGHIENNVLKVNQRESSGDLSGYSFHMADAGTDAYEREKSFLFASSEGRTLLEINEALRRVYGGTYGVCEISGKPISRPRLEAIPWVRYTLEVQEQMEKEERSRRSTP